MKFFLNECLTIYNFPICFSCLEFQLNKFHNNSKHQKRLVSRHNANLDSQKLTVMNAFYSEIENGYWSLIGVILTLKPKKLNFLS